MLIGRRAFLGGLSAVLVAREAAAYQPRGHPAAPGDTISFGPRQPWSGVSANFATHGRLRVNSSGRFLEHTDSTFFPYAGDTSFDVLGRLTLAETTSYLENRRAQGFTMTQCVPGGLFQLPNRNGDLPFVDLNTPNTNWFNFVDSVVAAALAKGIGVLFFLLWGNNYGIPGWPQTYFCGNFSSGQAGSFGTYMGNRYGSQPHVLFGIGGDQSQGQLTAQYLAMGAALKAAAPNSLITSHPGAGTSAGGTSVADYQSQTWLDFSGCQSSHYGEDNPQAYNLIASAYGASPTKPTINLESSYENTGINFNGAANGYFTPFDVRQQMWWSLVAGALGITYGNPTLDTYERAGVPWCCSDATAPFHDWINVLGWPQQPAASQVIHIRNLLQARPGLRTPDQTLVTSVGSGGATLLCCRGSNFAWVYSGYGGTFTVNMGKISGSNVRAYWYSAQTGVVIYINTYANSGTQSFTAPGGSSRGNDWVLLLDDASVAFPIPGVALSAA